jgi:hypothetical protein
VHPFDFIAYGSQLVLLLEVDEILVVDADDRKMGWDDHDIQIVDLEEFWGFSVGGSGHTGDLVVHTEEILKGDGG